MAIGNSKVTNFGAEVSFVDISAEIVLEYNSKNRTFEDTVSLSEDLVKTVTKPVSESVSIAEQIALHLTVNLTDSLTAGDIDTAASYYAGALNTAMLNFHGLNGSQYIRVDAVTIS